MFKTHAHTYHYIHAPSADASLPNGDTHTTQRQTLSVWLSALHDRDERYGFLTELALTLAGDKPACLIQNFDLVLDSGPFDSPAEALEFNHELGIVTKQLYKSNVWYGARTHFRLGLLPSSDSTKAGTNFRCRMGVFFGYPTGYRVVHQNATGRAHFATHPCRKRRVLTCRVGVC